MITQGKLKELLDYNPNTGNFTWLVTTSPRVKVTDIAGYKDCRGYIIIGILGEDYPAHRLAHFYMTGVWPVEIDHKDRVRHNNIWDNLRDTTHHENNKNASIRKDNKSGVSGVIFHKRLKRWYSQMGSGVNKINLGNSKDKFEAICLRKSAENRHGYYCK